MAADISQGWRTDGKGLPVPARVPTQLRAPRGPLFGDDRVADWDEVGDGARRAFDPSTLPD